MWQWIKGWWDTTAAISLIALVQPWVYWLWRKYGKSGHIDVHQTGTIEVGYSGLGATLGLQGTLRAVDREFFVSRMTLELVREADQSHHTFEWGAFQPPAILVGERKDPIEMPAGFMLQPLSPKRYNIVFVDMATQADIRQHLEPLAAAWFGEIQNIPPENQVQHYQENFSPRPLHVNTFTEVDRMNYWQAGNYRVELKIHTTRPDRDFDVSWRFTLTRADATALRNNAIRILIAGLNVSMPGRFQFAAAPYR